MKRSLWGYKGDDKVPFLKITLSDPKFVSKIRGRSVHFLARLETMADLSSAGILDRGEFEFRGMFNGPTTSYESNIAYTLRFMIDTKVLPKLPPCSFVPAPS
jgi:DNA polymerase delta subunit 1